MPPAPRHSRRKSGSFLIKLGRDTIGVEHDAISGNRLRGDAFTRQPRTSHLTYAGTRAPDGSITHLDVTRATTNPQNVAVVVKPSVDYRNDSAYVTIARNDSTINRVGPAAKGSIPVLGSTVYALQELAAMRGIKSGAPLTVLPLRPIGGPQPNTVPLTRAGDTLVIAQNGSRRNRRQAPSDRCRRMTPFTPSSAAPMSPYRDITAKPIAQPVGTFELAIEPAASAA
ncbi:MAG: hypothetical protein M3081_17430 [Gemmatimonadota bacterium]|nr:hypothetical protein [Gemmatimonadota bacterium]